jgi:hypothetical protein
VPIGKRTISGWKRINQISISRQLRFSFGMHLAI